MLVGYDSSDDSAVYKINDEQVMVQSVDLFPPMVDDPYDFGQIAAANALSDIYAMGAEPKLCLNIFAFPEEMNIKHVKSILEGGYNKVMEAGAVIGGGHTLKDHEPKYGLAVTGFARPEEILNNDSAKEGDVIILTKPIGNGIINNAAKKDLVSKLQQDMALKYMKMLNKYAYEIMKNYNSINSCTDITGFGLIGHIYEMATGSNKSIEILSDKVPLLDGTMDMAKLGILPGGARSNMAYVGKAVKANSKVSEDLIKVLHDPQTSGGLLISLPEKEGIKLQKELFEKTGVAEIVGVVNKKGEHPIIVK